MRSTIVLSILEPTLERAAEAMAAAPEGVGFVEIRGDALRADAVGSLVARSTHPVLVAVRTPRDGGRFEGTPDEKRLILEAALRAGAAAVDVEWDGPLRDLASGPDASRVILSHHGGACDLRSLRPLFDAMASRTAARLKIVPVARHPSDIEAVRAILGHARAAGRPLACFASGRPGTASRILASSWGSWGTYAPLARGHETALGQLPASELAAVYRADALTEATARFALFGTPVGESPTPALHAAGFRAAGLDAVTIPVETGDPAEVERMAGLLDLRGFAVTIPLKEKIAERCARLDRFASCGAVNTVVRGEDGWHGYNTDAPAAVALVAPLVPLRGASVAIAGAGGTARAIGAAFAGEGARVTLFGRDSARTESTAAAIGAGARPFEELRGAPWDVLVQATPLGRGGEEVLPEDALRGRVVLDAAYGPSDSPLIRAARRRGIPAFDGRRLLLEQGLLQLEILTGARPDPKALAAAIGLRVPPPLP